MFLKAVSSGALLAIAALAIPAAPAQAQTYAANLDKVYCDIKRPLRKITGVGSGPAFTDANYRPILKALRDKMRCNGVRIEILTSIRNANNYPQLYKDVLDEARRLGLEIYSSPAEYAELLPDDLRNDETKYINWVANHLNRFKPKFAGIFNESGFGDAKMRRILSGVKGKLDSGYNPQFIGPDKNKLSASLSSIRNSTIYQEFVQFGTHDVGNTAQPGDWQTLVNEARAKGKNVWWTEASGDATHTRQIVATNIRRITLYWAFPRMVDESGNLTDLGRQTVSAVAN